MSGKDYPTQSTETEKSIKQTDTPWKQPEKEQGDGAKKSDVDKWSETNTH